MTHFIYQGFLKILFSTSFLFGIILDLKKLQRWYSEFPYTPHPVSPNVIISHYYGTSVKSKKSALVHHCGRQHSKIPPGIHIPSPSYSIKY